MQSRSFRKATEGAPLEQRLPLFALAALIAPAALAAQQSDAPDPQARSVFVEQAPQDERTMPLPQPRKDQSSKVYFPDEITPEAVAASRARAQAEAAQQQQLATSGSGTAAGSGVAQLSQAGESDREVDQLSDGRSAEALAQLTPAEREVLIDAVVGTDICERQQNIPALQALCEDRLEDRSADFAQNRQGVTAAEALLGESLDEDRIATLEAAIARLARNSAQTGGVDDSVIASVAFTGQSLASNQAAAESNPADDLSPETQSLINAIVQQLGGP